MVVNDGIGPDEHPRVLSRRIHEIQIAAKMDILHSGSIGLSQIDMIDHLEVAGLKNSDLRAKLVEVLAVGGNFNPPHSIVALVLRLFFLGDVHRLNDLLLLQIDEGVLGLGDFVMFGKLRDLFGDRVKKLALGIRRPLKEADIAWSEY